MIDVLKIFRRNRSTATSNEDSEKIDFDQSFLNSLLCEYHTTYCEMLKAEFENNSDDRFMYYSLAIRKMNEIDVYCLNTEAVVRRLTPLEYLCDDFALYKNYLYTFEEPEIILESAKCGKYNEESIEVSIAVAVRISFGFYSIVNRPDPASDFKLPIAC